jgi:argonaute-like protein implicated in RNA metabolism and viral defense
VKFDRVNKTGDYQSYTQNQTFVATGTTAVFELGYAPTRDKTKITILKNNQLVLTNEYTISLYFLATDSYSLLRGKIAFNTSPLAGDIITVSYETG